MAHLKAKVAAGADLVVTQLFYSTELFVDYVRRCRLAGITVRNHFYVATIQYMYVCMYVCMYV